MKIQEVWAEGQHLFVGADSNADLNMHVSSRQLFRTHDVSCIIAVHISVFVRKKKFLTSAEINTGWFFSQLKGLVEPDVKDTRKPSQTSKVCLFQEVTSCYHILQTTGKQLKGVSPHARTTKSLNPALPFHNKALHLK